MTSSPAVALGLEQTLELPREVKRLVGGRPGARGARPGGVHHPHVSGDVVAPRRAVRARGAAVGLKGRVGGGEVSVEHVLAIGPAVALAALRARDHRVAGAGAGAGAGAAPQQSLLQHNTTRSAPENKNGPRPAPQ